MATPPAQVTLLYGSRRACLELPAARRGAVRALEREAERCFSLQPGSFVLNGPAGRVDSPGALQGALRAGEACVLEVSEHPEWRILNAASAALEACIMEKVEARLAEKLDSGLAPLVQRVEALERPAAPLEACKAPQLLLLSSRPQELEAPEATCDDLEALERRLREELGAGQDYLFSELQVAKDCAAAAQKDVQQLQAQLEAAEQRLSGPHAAEEETRAAASALRCPQGCLDAFPGEAPTPGGSLGPDAWLSWSKGLPAALPYSGKVSVEQLRGGAAARLRGKRGAVEGPTAPFARGGTPLRPIERSPGCQSLPLLPPLR